MVSGSGLRVCCAPRNTKEESLERDVRKVLDGCIRSLEPKRGRGRARSTDDGPVLKVMDRMLLKAGCSAPHNGTPRFCSTQACTLLVQ